MHKGLMGGLVALALVGAGVGGCYVIDNKVRTAVQHNVDDLTKASPLITSITFDGLDVNFFADELILHKVELSLDLSQLPDLYSTMPDGMDIKGTSTQSVETITIKGLRDIVLGGTMIRQIDVDDINFGADMTETMPLPQERQQPNLSDEEHPPKSLSTSTVMSGTLPHAEFYGFDMTQLAKATAEMPLPYKVERYEAKDAQIILVIKQVSNGLTDPLTGEPQKVPPLHADLSISRIIGTNVSNDSIGVLRYENTIANLSNSENFKKPVLVKMAELSMTDTKIVDMMPVRSTMEIKGLEFDTSNMDNPKGKAIMAMLGIDQINLNLKTSYDFDPDHHTLTVSAFRFGLKQAGSIDVNFALSGLPEIDELRKLGDLKKAAEQAQAKASEPEMEQAPDQVQEPLPEQLQVESKVEATFKDLSISQIALQYQDEGILKKFLGAQAMQLNAAPAQLAEAYAQQAAKIITATHGAETAEKAQKVLVAFLTNPDTLRVELKSTSPVNLKGLSEQFKVSGPVALNAFDLNVQGGAEVLSN